MLKEPFYADFYNVCFYIGYIFLCRQCFNAILEGGPVLSERLFLVAALLQRAEGVDQTQCTESYFLNHHGARVQLLSITDSHYIRSLIFMTNNLLYT